MPTYAFKNKHSGELFEKMMKISEKDQFLKEHPELDSVPVCATGVGVDLNPRHIDGGFKEVLGRIRHGGLVGRNNNIDKYL